MGVSNDRRGDDIFVNGKKLTVSIATAGISSEKIHCGINLISSGTPAEANAIGLRDLGIEHDLWKNIGKDIADLQNEMLECLKGGNRMISDDVILAVFVSDEQFRNVLSRVIKDELGMTAIEFSKCASIPHSTLYKILSGHREPNVKTLRAIVHAIRELEGREKNFIAVIAARPVLDRITERQLLIGGESVVVREYAAATMEDAIIAAVRAERDGASALVCAPIVSPTVEKILSIPVATINPTSSIVRAIELAARKRSH